MTSPVLRVVIGAGDTSFKGWISTDVETLDILNDGEWRSLFAPNSIANLLAEHVWEHLSEADGLRAAQNCFRYLKPGGVLRIAVPDGYHPDPKYIQYVDVGQSGHLILYNHRNLENLLKQAGFEIRSLEYFDEAGKFHQSDWDQAEGYVGRSIRFDSRNENGKPVYTSLIIDAIKP